MERRAGFAVTRTFLAIYFLILHSVTANEPRCSSFSYEASTLEKMIRTEIKVEQMRREIEEEKDGIKETERNVANMLQELKEQKADIKAILRERESEIKRGILELERNVTNKLQELETQTKDMKAIPEKIMKELEHFKNRTVTELKESPLSPTVVFHASGLADTSPSKGQTIVFPKTAYNEGHGYNSATGHFTAPFTGLYHFSIQLCGNPEMQFNWEIVIQNSIAKSGVIEHSDHACGASDLGRILRKGESVWVRCAYTSSGTVLYIDRYSHSTFSGYLVHLT